MANFEDDALSASIRAEKGLPENWRVYLYEAVDNGVRLTGALARPVTQYELREGEVEGFSYRWIHPLEMKRTKTVSREFYSKAIMVRTKPPQQEPRK